MKLAVLNWLDKEREHYHQLPAALRAMVRSIAWYQLSFPIVMVFVSAFVLRVSGSVELVAFYNVGLYISVPLVFVLNAQLWRWINFKWLYILGTVGQGFATFWLMSFETLDLARVIIIGLVLGVPIGFYFANRNVLEQQLTTDRNRNYYAGLKGAVATAAGVFMPALVGFFIKWGQVSGLYSLRTGYLLVASVMVLTLSWAGWLTTKVNVDSPQAGKLLLGASRKWWLLRVGQVCWGFHNAVEFLVPSILVFAVLGSEETLGTIQSAAALASAAGIFYLGKWLKPSKRWITLLYASVGTLLISTLVATTFSAYSVAVYLVLIGVLSRVSWSVKEPLYMREVDSLKTKQRPHSSFVIDQEIWLNVGRLLAIGIFIWMLRNLDQNLALRLLPLSSGITVMVMVALIWPFRK